MQDRCSHVEEQACESVKNRVFGCSKISKPMKRFVVKPIGYALSFTLSGICNSNYTKKDDVLKYTQSNLSLIKYARVLWFGSSVGRFAKNPYLIL
jgi:hypothetical protein